MAAMCKICISPYREELMRAWGAHFPRKLLHEKYQPLIWGKHKITFASFAQAVRLHKDHKTPGVVILQTTGGSVGKDLNGIAKMITSLYAEKVEKMSSDDITTKDYVAVNKLVLEEKKLKLDEKEQMMELAKLFGIPEIINPLDVIVGTEEHAELRPPESP